MGAAILPLPAPVPTTGIGRTIGTVAPAVVCGLLLAVATVIVYPFETDTIVPLAQNQLVATHYAPYNTIFGIDVTAGNLLTGAAPDAAARAGMHALLWISRTTLGLICADAIHLLSRPGRRSATGKKEVAELTGRPWSGAELDFLHAHLVSLYELLDAHAPVKAAVAILGSGRSAVPVVKWSPSAGACGG
ncbi:hypothetical protein KQY30_35375 [Streptomyces sp. GMY02]|uniref:hypothetical protein n=1 Tax=Streptomyces sp. GMY02 TaxID=1333528 RepID=UPI001C2BF141|nr:hypothetical protein [Streptomyces sp. GMY02]QXE38716.1 hypothetical protein KQY30_35375 [Streptomyces sp. GMY02]